MNVPPRKAIWIRLPKFIGDGVMIHRAVEPLRRLGLPLVAWGPSPVVELFEGSGAFAGTWADGQERPGAWVVSRMLRTHEAAAVINLPRSTRALLPAWLARIPLRAGWNEGGGWLLATHHLSFRSVDGHQMLRYKVLLEMAYPGLPEAPFTPFRPRDQAVDEANRVLERLGMARSPFVVLGLGAMAWQKRLGTSVWVALIQRLRDQGVSHVLVGGPGADQEQAAEILGCLPGVPDLTGRLALSVTAAVIAQACALVGNDSALGHLAAACGTPAVLAFGPTHPDRTAPIGIGIQVVQKRGLSCLGCLGGCDVPGHPCMEQLDPEDLWRPLDALLNAKPDGS